MKSTALSQTHTTESSCLKTHASAHGDINYEIFVVLFVALLILALVWSNKKARPFLTELR